MLKNYQIIKNGLQDTNYFLEVPQGIFMLIFYQEVVLKVNFTTILIAM
jgi:hypothetical protein